MVESKRFYVTLAFHKEERDDFDRLMKSNSFKKRSTFLKWFYEKFKSDLIKEVLNG